PKTNTKEYVIDFDGPTKYADAVKKVFGMKEKALTLFSQMIGLKVLGNLDEFIRKNMLEENNVEEHFQTLRGHFQKLLDAHKDIQQLDKDIKGKEQEKREEKLKKYNRAAGEINFSESPDEALFIEQIQKGKDRAKEIETELNDKETGIKIKWSDLRNTNKKLN